MRRWRYWENKTMRKRLAKLAELPELGKSAPCFHMLILHIFFQNPIVTMLTIFWLLNFFVGPGRYKFASFWEQTRIHSRWNWLKRIFQSEGMRCETQGIPTSWLPIRRKKTSLVSSLK